MISDKRLLYSLRQVWKPIVRGVVNFLFELIVSGLLTLLVATVASKVVFLACFAPIVLLPLGRQRQQS